MEDMYFESGPEEWVRLYKSGRRLSNREQGAEKHSFLKKQLE